MLPHDFPPWQTVYWWFRRLMRRFLFRTLHDVVLMLDRALAGRQPCPSAGAIDSQTVKAPSVDKPPSLRAAPYATVGGGMDHQPLSGLV
ncbi:hypothetical protein ACEQUB_p01388 (plasmid) [Ralstonia syzygii]|uniref:Transposase n=1 Tax=Ralstonia syzygii R24 TaxID=907261 RepID=G3ABF5_9RALS|nr:hypothetical protein RALSY_mp30161 [Ralstonia syzygii R24]